MALPVDADVRLAMVWGEEEIPSLPQRFEGIVVGEGLSDLYELLEEELLLAIPLAPRHPEGECALRQTVESDEVADDDERENRLPRSRRSREFILRPVGHGAGIRFQ